MPYADDAAVPGQTSTLHGKIPCETAAVVQERTAARAAKNAGVCSSLADELDRLLRSSLLPVEDAAAILRIEPKRLRGFIARNTLADPIGDWQQVYGWSCAELARRADAGTDGR